MHNVYYMVTYNVLWLRERGVKVLIFVLEILEIAFESARVKTGSFFK